jgi:hypothetical protein
MQTVSERFGGKGENSPLIRFNQLKKEYPEISFVAAFTKKYPDLQIAVPVHTEQMKNIKFIPAVTFLQEEFDEGVTDFMVGFRGDTIVLLDARIKPDKAVVVIGMCERTQRGILIDRRLAYENVTPPTPMNLTGQVVEFGIYLTWTMPSGTNMSNVSGYRIYRKAGTEVNYTLLATTLGHTNREYADQNVRDNVTYRYYVEAYNEYQTSDASNYFTITAARPNGVSAFAVEQEALNIVKLSWSFAQNDYNGNVNIYKRIIGSSTSYNNPFVTLPMPADDYFDTNITPGKTVEYKIERTTAIGTSTPKYDFIYTPYRDMNNYSKVFIKKIKYDKISKIEAWGKGAPEFKIKVLGINGSNTTELAELFIRLDSRNDNVWTTVSSSSSTVTNYWKPGKYNWYESISFYFVEDDGIGGWWTNFWETLTLMGQKLGKAFTNATSPNWLNGTLEALPVLGKAVDNLCRDQDERIGYAHLNYYDDPCRTYETNSAETEGRLTVQFGN